VRPDINLNRRIDKAPEQELYQNPKQNVEDHCFGILAYLGQRGREHETLASRGDTQHLFQVLLDLLI
jgi:hypothetical protein